MIFSALTKLIVLLCPLVASTFLNADDFAKVPDVRGGATLQITDPKSLVDATKGGMLDISLGNFGHIQYGSTIMGTLVFPETNQWGCKPFTEFFKGNSLVLVEAGECPITTKVRNIEHAGG